jgi:hypothetical protein
MNAAIERMLMAFEPVVQGAPQWPALEEAFAHVIEFRVRSFKLPGDERSATILDRTPST